MTGNARWAHLDFFRNVSTGGRTVCVETTHAIEVDWRYFPITGRWQCGDQSFPICEFTMRNQRSESPFAGYQPAEAHGDKRVGEDVGLARYDDYMAFGLNAEYISAPRNAPPSAL